MDRLLTTEEVAEYLRVEVVTIRRLINRNELAAYRIGGEYRFTESDIGDFLTRQRVPANVLAGTIDTGSLFGLIHKVLQGKQISSGEVDRFDRFTDQARRILRLSQEAAQSFQHNYIGTEHLLLGLADQREGVAIQVLRNLDIEPEKIREDIEGIIGRGERVVGERVVHGEARLTQQAKKVIEMAVDEARRFNHNYIGTEHLLLGCLREGEGVAASVLGRLGVTLENVRTETLHVLSQPQATETAPVPPIPPEATSLLSEGEQGLTCNYCGARVPGYFHYCFNCGRALSDK